MDWERLDRCVDRLKRGDTFNASWVSGALGVAGGAGLALINAFVTASDKHPQTPAKILFVVLAVAALALAYIVWKIEERARGDRYEPIDVLREELDAVKKYAKDHPTALGPPDGPSQ